MRAGALHEAASHAARGDLLRRTHCAPVPQQTGRLVHPLAPTGLPSAGKGCSGSWPRRGALVWGRERGAGGSRQEVMGCQSCLGEQSALGESLELGSAVLR